MKVYKDTVNSSSEYPQFIPSVSKHIYKSLITRVSTPPAAVAKWNLYFNITATQWEKIFQAPFRSVRDSKLQYFQFRFLHRIIGTNHYRHKMGQIDNPRCHFCGRYDETLLHLFWDCPIISNFILDVEQAIFGRQFILSKNDICFGLHYSVNHPYNFLIFHLKYFIFSKKNSNTEMRCRDFLYKLKFAIKLEKELKQRGKAFISYEQLKDSFSNCTILFS